jgi:signal transduction histidine kinase
MLSDFLLRQRTELIQRARAKVAKRPSPRPTEDEIKHGVPIFLGQLVDTLKREAARQPVPAEAMGTSAGLHGDELLRLGFTVEQVVHDYGDICQAITELAMERQVDITTEEFHTLNRCLDNAIASAVTEYTHLRDVFVAGNEVERLGYFAHELRNLLASLTLTFEVMRRGTVGVSGSTARLHARTLASVGTLIDRTLTEVRLKAHLLSDVPLRVTEMIEDVVVPAKVTANTRGLRLTVKPGSSEVFVSGDRQLLSSAIANLVQNAIKFTHAHGSVTLSSRVADDRVLIEVADECGGLPPSLAKDLARPFHQASADRSGLGLGLAIVQKSVAASHGALVVRDIPGHGCVFTIDLPQSGADG